MATRDDVGRIVNELPETAESSPRNWRVCKKLIAWERPLRKADVAALGAAAPDVIASPRPRLPIATAAA